MDSIGKFARAIDVLREDVKDDLKVQHLRLLIGLMASEPEPLGYSDLIAITGASKSSVSRATKMLGVEMVQTKKDGPWVDKGLGLVDVRPDPYHPRQFLVSLTKKGTDLRTKLQKVLM